MTYRYWQAGLHIQDDAMVCIALQQARGGWALRRWWQQALTPHSTDADRTATLRKWRREMPVQHRIAVALPAGGTLRKVLPAPGLVLRDSEQAQWIISSMAQQLEMAEASLAFDYCQATRGGFQVTAARQQDVLRLRKMAKGAGLNLAAVTPDASALLAFLPWLPDGAGGVSWFDGERWLWAAGEEWGCADHPAPGSLVCGSGINDFDPWHCLSQLQPPLPVNGDTFTIALALALGGHRDAAAG